MTEFIEYLKPHIAAAIALLPGLLLTLILLIVGWWLANRATKVFAKYLNHTKIGNPEVKSFLSSLAGICFKVLLLISIAGMVGIETTSFVGIIAALGFAIGLALQGHLSNFSAGILILVLKPFKVGDEVELQSTYGFVDRIEIFHTVVRKFDHTRVILPNGLIMGGTIRNLSMSEVRRILIPMRIPFNEDIRKVREIIVNAVAEVEQVTVEPSFWYGDFEDHGIKITAVIDAPLLGFWGTSHHTRQTVIDALNENKIKISYPIGVTFGEYGVDRNESNGQPTK